eukprot:5231493-Alexandrium_andersonii.AAC.1
MVRHGCRARLLARAPAEEDPREGAGGGAEQAALGPPHRQQECRGDRRAQACRAPGSLRAG